MKKYTLLVIALSVGSQLLGAAPQFDIDVISPHEEQHEAKYQLETLINYAHQAIQEADSVRIISCFAPCISVKLDGRNSASEMTREAFVEVAISKYGSFSAFASHLDFLLSGFVLSHEENEPYFINQHSMGESSLSTLSILGDHVNFRRSPSLKSPVICSLSRGIYRGKFNPEVWDIEDAQGITWTSVMIDHEQLGMISGYMSASFVEEVDPGSTPIIEVRQSNHKWRIERFSFTGF